MKPPQWLEITPVLAVAGILLAAAWMAKGLTGAIVVGAGVIAMIIRWAGWV